jgi:ABC-type transport system involved in multi-copper enzyme maturation permease subunit
VSAAWRRQLFAVMRLELRKSFLGGRALWLYLLAAAPVAVIALRGVLPHTIENPSEVGEATDFYAGTFQLFALRVVIFLACVAVFGNLIRREMLDRTLHYYLLAPLRREVLLAAKYLTGLAVTVVLFTASTAMGFFLAYAPHDGAAVERFLFQGPGLRHLGAYLLVTVLGCIGYGAVFLTFGFFFKSPALPALAVFGWEAIHFLLPPLFKKASVIHYLQSLCPVPISEGPLAILSDAPSPWLAIPGLLLFTALLLAISAQRTRRLEVSYEED